MHINIYNTDVRHLQVLYLTHLLNQEKDDLMKHTFLLFLTKVKVVLVFFVLFYTFRDIIFISYQLVIF